MNIKKLDLQTLHAEVNGSAAAFRCRRRLQPAGGPGDKVFPPTFAGAVYAVEQRRVFGDDGKPLPEPKTCVVLDTVQSQANRMELALQEALNAGRIQIPVIQVDFSEWSPNGQKPEAERFIDDVGVITSLQVPHRLADAILRDSQIEEEANGEKKEMPFRESSKGKALNTASPQNATPVYQLCPTALIFGMWDSTGPKGGLGAKFERAVVSEVIGVGAQIGDLLRGVRRDPLEIRSAIKVVKPADGNWSVAAADDKKPVAPSEINHSSVPFPKQRDRKTDDNMYAGITIEYAEQLTTLSLIVLRRLHFPINGTASAETDAAGRTVLAALGLCAATLAFESGLALRSRCLIWPEAPMNWELLETPGAEPKKFSLTTNEAITLLTEAVEAAREKGLTWLEDPITLVPQPKLAELVRKSQIEATKE